MKTRNLFIALLLILAAASAQAAVDPTIACGIKKMSILNRYDQCLDKALSVTDSVKQQTALTKCHDKCTAGFTTAENKPDVTCAQEGNISQSCGPSSATFNRAVCRHQFLMFGSSSCYP